VHQPPDEQASFRQYLQSRELWLTLALLIGGGIAMLFLFFEGILPQITRHNESIIVPRVVNKPLAEAREQLHEKHLKVKVDSQYRPALPPLTVLIQEPRGLARIKPGRTVYLVVNQTQPPTVKLPDILEVNLQQATYMLENWDLNAGKIEMVDGRAPNQVQRAEVNGREVRPGDPVQKGTTVDLFVSKGLGKEKVALPDVTGIPIAEASALLQYYNLSIGEVRFDSLSYKEPGLVLSQYPKSSGIDSVFEGLSVDLQVAGRPEEVLKDGELPAPAPDYQPPPDSAAPPPSPIEPSPPAPGEAP